MFKKILEKIIEFDTIIVHRHKRPDGDCMGTQAGLVHTLRNSFPNKKIYAVGFFGIACTTECKDRKVFSFVRERNSADTFLCSEMSVIFLEYVPSSFLTGTHTT